MFFCSVNGSVRPNGVAILSTGNHSPVRDDSFTIKLFALSSRMSAGIAPPPLKTTMSPGTSSAAGIT